MAGAQKFLIAALLRNAAAGQQWGAAAQHANVAAVAAAATTALLIRNSSFQSSPKVRPLAEYPEVEVVRNAPEWQFVERLLPPAIIPKPKLPPAACHSGWRPQLAATATGTAAGGSADALRYFVARTKNHMIPVYLQTTHRGERRITVVRRVQGDIWALERELRALVEKARNGRLCASRVNEMSGQVRFHGDHVDLLRDYLKEKGF